MDRSEGYRPFECLRDLASSDARRVRTAEKPAPPQVDRSQDISDEELFERYMQDVSPLGWSQTPIPSSQPIEVRNPQQSEDEGLRLLAEFVAGKGGIDLVATGEYVEGSPGRDGARWIHSLRNGRFAVQAHLDLHGHSLREAREGLETFLRESLRRGLTCVRIVHGRGHHSPKDHSVLKEHVQRWLSSRRLGRHVVAYTSSRLYDGGGGALYVLLRKRRA
ncbi:MAG: Smr/MutS family protein [Acidobacteriota bacterium]